MIMAGVTMAMAAVTMVMAVLTMIMAAIPMAMGAVPMAMAALPMIMAAVTMGRGFAVHKRGRGRPDAVSLSTPIPPTPFSSLSNLHYFFSSSSSSSASACTLALLKPRFMETPALAWRMVSATRLKELMLTPPVSPSPRPGANTRGVCP